MDITQVFLVIAATSAAIVVPFVVVPEILERKGLDPRSAFVRGIVWISFLTMVFVPAIASGFVLSVRNPADWLIFAIAMTTAILYDYFRLNPEKVPWARART